MSKTRPEWLELLQRCQNGEATCLFVLNEIEKAQESALAARDALVVTLGEAIPLPLMCAANLAGYLDQMRAEGSIKLVEIPDGVFLRKLKQGLCDYAAALAGVKGERK